MIEIKGVLLPQGNRDDPRDLFMIKVWTDTTNTTHLFQVMQGEVVITYGKLSKEHSAHQNIYHVLGNILTAMEEQGIVPAAGTNYIKRGGYKP